jgi:tRNA-Thr(GGU) m(6)t(6)A37 methyltransferase TsaA
MRPVGVIHTPFKTSEGTPIQAVYASGIEGKIVVHKGFEPSLADIEGFELLWLVYWMDRAGPYRPRVVPYRDTREHGLFATRAPCRPNPIGLSVARLLGREGRHLKIADVDILDGTPLLDIKPYVPEFDAFPAVRAGWLDDPGSERRLADCRFHPRRRRVAQRRH